MLREEAGVLSRAILQTCIAIGSAKSALNKNASFLSLVHNIILLYIDGRCRDVDGAYCLYRNIVVHKVFEYSKHDSSHEGILESSTSLKITALCF